MKLMYRWPFWPGHSQSKEIFDLRESLLVSYHQAKGYHQWEAIWTTLPPFSKQQHVQQDCWRGLTSLWGGRGWRSNPPNHAACLLGKGLEATIPFLSQAVKKSHCWQINPSVAWVVLTQQTSRIGRWGKQCSTASNTAQPMRIKDRKCPFLYTLMYFMYTWSVIIGVCTGPEEHVLVNI